MKYLHEDKDPFNKYGTRNAGNTGITHYNCLSYAFHTYSWARPYRDFEDRMGYVENILEDPRISYDDCAEILLEEDVEWILKNMNDRARIIYDEDEDLEEDEYLVAFREFVGEDCENWGCNDTDFHAMIRIDGEWYEKCGTRGPKKVKRPWYNDMGFEYNSSTAYFAVKDIR